MAAFQSCRKFSHFITQLDTLERSHTDGKITRLVSFPVCQQVEAGAPIYPVTHTRDHRRHPPTDASRRQNHNAKRAARTAGISRASGLFCGIT